MPIPRHGKLDTNGILRSKSRIKNCPFQFLAPFLTYNKNSPLFNYGAPFLTHNEKYPIILDRYSHLAQMIALDYHRIYMHSGPELILSAILRRFHIIRGKRIVKSIAYECTKGLCYTGRCMSHQMASLPIDRRTFTFLFAAKGVD